MNRFQIQHDRTYMELTNNENLLGLRDHVFSGIPRKVIHTFSCFSKKKKPREKIQDLILLLAEMNEIYLPEEALKYKTIEY